MSLTVIALLAALAVGVVALFWWRRSRASAETPSARDGDEAPRFETTMGELRDLREALRPSERAAREAAPRYREVRPKSAQRR